MHARRAVSCCAQQLRWIVPRPGRRTLDLDHGARAEEAGGRGITWPGCPGSGEPPAHPRCTTGHLVWSCRPTGQMIPPPGSGTGTQPDRRRTLHCRCLARLAFLERSFVSPRPTQAATGRNLLRASATPAVDPDVACRRKKLQFSTSSGRCSADLVQAEADADCY